MSQPKIFPAAGPAAAATTFGYAKRQRDTEQRPGARWRSLRGAKNTKELNVTQKKPGLGQTRTIPAGPDRDRGAQPLELYGGPNH